MKRQVPVESASALIDERIKELGDWRGMTLARVRELVHAADPEIVEEWKWMGTPVWSHAGIVCTGETHKNVVKMTFAKGAALQDPSGLFNSSLDGNVRRAIDIHESDNVDEAALKYLIRSAVAFNLWVRASRSPGERAASGPTSSVAATQVRPRCRWTACARGLLGERPASSRTAQACCSTGQLGRISAHPLTVPPRGHEQWPLGRRTVLAQLALALRRAR